MAPSKDSRGKSDVLLNIENLWQQAAPSSAEEPPPSKTSKSKASESKVNDSKTTFSRISTLMDTASTAANDSPPPVPQSKDDGAKDDEATIEALAELVDEAASPESSSPPVEAKADTFEQDKSRMDKLAKVKPPQSDNSKSSTNEYAFGDKFAHSVRQVVRDYVNNEVEGVIRKTIKTELDAYFLDKDASSSKAGGRSDGKK